MTVRWRTNFINSGQTLQETDLGTIRTYMVQQEIQTNDHQKSLVTKTSRNNRESRLTPAQIPSIDSLDAIPLRRIIRAIKKKGEN